MSAATLPTYVSRVTCYRKSGSLRSLTPTEALAYIETNPGDVDLMLGAMRPGYLGREMVTEDDLRRWEHEANDAAAWADIEDGEKAAAEMGLLR